jgi:hypothetical protein
MRLRASNASASSSVCGAAWGTQYAGEAVPGMQFRRDGHGSPLGFLILPRPLPGGCVEFRRRSEGIACASSLRPEPQRGLWSGTTLLLWSVVDGRWEWLVT